MVTSLATPQAALDTPDTFPSLTVYIGGVLTDGIVAYDGQHNVGRVATGSLDLLLPRASQIEPLAPVEVQGGHNDLIGTLFSGFIPSYESSLSMRGKRLTVDLRGQAHRMTEPLTYDLVFPGPVSLRSVFVRLCDICGVPSYIADHTTHPDGVTEIMLGGNPQVDDGQVICPAGTSPFAWFNRQANPYEYYAQDTLQGPVTLKRVNGIPPEAAAVTWREAQNVHEARRAVDVSNIVTLWDVVGTTYTDEYGGKIPVRSRPTSVTPRPDIPALPGGGIRYREYQNRDLVTQAQADAVRQNLEIRHASPYTPVSWRSKGVPFVTPADIVQLHADTVETAGPYWMMGSDVTWSMQGLKGAFQGWAGAGHPLSTLNDRVTVPIQGPALHLGDEYVSWYAHPAHQGAEKTWTLSLPDKVSVANVRGWHHSTNSQLVGGVDIDLAMSSWEIWKAGVDRTNKENRPESSGKLARLPERYAERPAFWRFDSYVTNDGTTVVTNAYDWVPFAINLRSLDKGEYVLVLRAGKGVGLDDFEVRAVFLELFGTIDPAIIIVPEAA